MIGENYMKQIILSLKHWVNNNFALKENIPEVPVTSVNNMTGDVIIEIPEGFSGSWNDLEDKPFYEESRVLYDGYPSYKWGYAKLPFALKGGVTYSIGYYTSDGSVSVRQHTAESNNNGIVTINFTDSIEGVESFRLDYDPENPDSGSYFYGDGTLWKEGEPETSEDGSYAYLSHVRLIITYVYDEDIDVVTLNDKFISNNIARVSDIPKELTEDEVLQILIECGVIDPATDENGNIIIDADNTIISI